MQTRKIIRHTCHVPGCDKVVARKMLCCARHWSLVPMQIRLQVNRTFNPKQCVPGSGVRPTQEWLRAARAAINAVVEREATT